MHPSPVVRASTADRYDAHVMRNYARAPLTLVRGAKGMSGSLPEHPAGLRRHDRVKSPMRAPIPAFGQFPTNMF